MSEARSYFFSHQEVVESLIKKQNIHEGNWSLVVTFGLKAITAGQPPDEYYPSAIIPVLKLGIQKTKEKNNLTVDASKVNPSPKKRKVAARKTTPRKK